jgi:hypothetical protein
MLRNKWRNFILPVAILALKNATLGQRVHTDVLLEMCSAFSHYPCIWNTF